MKLQRPLALLCTLLLWTAIPAMGQVERVAMRTTGISCGTCALVSEINFRRLAGVEKVTISRSNEAVLISYKPGFAFNPQQLREILKRLDVGVVQFQISARGRVRQEGGKQFFVAGTDKFVLTPDAKSPQLSTATPVLIEGIVNDRVNPMELRVMTSKPVPLK